MDISSGIITLEPEWVCSLWSHILQLGVVYPCNSYLQFRTANIRNIDNVTAEHWGATPRGGYRITTWLMKTPWAKTSFLFSKPIATAYKNANSLPFNRIAVGHRWRWRWEKEIDYKEHVIYYIKLIKLTISLWHRILFLSVLSLKGKTTHNKKSSPTHIPVFTYWSWVMTYKF